MKIRVTEDELVRDIAAVLDKVRAGAEVVVERDHVPVAMIQAPKRSGRRASEILADAARNPSRATLDPEFPTDLDDIIRTNSEPWNPPSWD